MGMEALETAVAYWEDALEAYLPRGSDRKNRLAVTTREESRSDWSLFMN